MKQINYGDLKFVNKDINLLLSEISRNLTKKNNPKIVNFINPHSYINYITDSEFRNAVKKSNINLIDGVGLSLVLFIENFFLKKIHRITGYDLFEKILKLRKKLFFIGSTKQTLKKIKIRFISEYPDIQIGTYSPPFKTKFDENDYNLAVKKINNFKPDIVFFGMTAPKQEKFSINICKKIKAKYIFNVGAVFDYYALNIFRPNQIIRKLGLEWLFRLIQNPKLWRRTFISGFIFLILSIKKIFINFPKITIIEVIDKVFFINKILKRKKYIFSAFNLSGFTNIMLKKINVHKNIFFWSDGIFCNYFDKSIKKIPGYKLISILKLPKEIKQIEVVGNLNEKDYNYIKKRFNKKILLHRIPYGNIKYILRFSPKVKSNSLTLITLPTPKQEQIAQKIFKIQKNAKIICLGGGIQIASGTQKKPNKFFYKYKLEYIWRLQNDTYRRLLRLSKDIIIFIYNLINFKIIFYNVKKY